MTFAKRVFTYLFAANIFTYIYIYILGDFQRESFPLKIFYSFFFALKTHGKQQERFRKTAQFSLSRSSRINTRENIDRPEPRRAKSGKKKSDRSPDEKKRRRGNIGGRTGLVSVWCAHFRRESLALAEYKRLLRDDPARVVGRHSPNRPRIDSDNTTEMATRNLHPRVENRPAGPVEAARI